MTIFELIAQLVTNEGLSASALFHLQVFAAEESRRYDATNAELAAANARVAVLEAALRGMLHIFDRELRTGTVGRRTCDDARAALAGDAGARSE
jgi:hypothetical protein